MEGVVKFNCHWSQSGPIISDEQYEIINYWREILYNMDLIGAYENGVGFGNISMRIKGGNQFVITGSHWEIPNLSPTLCQGQFFTRRQCCSVRAPESFIRIADSCCHLPC
jgi:hypothetical protein